MKTIFFIGIICCFFACEINTQPKTEKQIENNNELLEIYQKDQADRMAKNISWDIVAKNDSLRIVQVIQLLQSNKVQTAQDYYHAAMIFQHGDDSTTYKMAIKMMQKAIAIDSTINKWLLAASIDRYLMSKNEPQIYGTQYIQYQNEPMQLYVIDTNKISDAERIAYGVKTLAEQQAHLKLLNKASDL